MSQSIVLTVNGTKHTVPVGSGTEITPQTSLATFLRITLGLTGTKISCHEGGCGACTVTLTYTDPVSGKAVSRGVNSCLRPLYSCNGMTVTTVEGLGGSATAYHPLQQRLADASGTQCGYCSPGMVMAMYSLLSRNPNPTKLEIERELDGNLCRCTGYRPILDAFKSFGQGATEEDDCRETGCKRQGLFKDIEEIPPMHHDVKLKGTYKHSGPRVHISSAKEKRGGIVHAADNGTLWHDLEMESDIQYWLPYYLQQFKSVMLVGARTSLGVYPNTQYDVMLNISQVQSLRVIHQDPTAGITIGAMSPISDMIDYLQTCQAPTPYGGAHLLQAVSHLHRVAGHSIRNVASVAGNLMMAQDNVFPSDVVIVLIGLGATVQIVDCATKTTTSYSLTDFVQVSPSTVSQGKYIASITIPWAAPNEIFMSYKIAQRQVMSHAIVNAAMKCVVDPVTHRISGTPIVAYGGIASKQFRVTAIESAMVGIDVTNTQSFQSLCTALQALIVPDPAQGHVSYRHSIALTFYYKFFLAMQPKGTLPSQLTSAIPPWFLRRLTVASQAFQPNPAEYPVSKGIPKLEGIAQTSGEAIFTDDIEKASDALHAALVLAPVANCTIDPKAIDISAAKAVSGFVTFYSALDVFSQTANASACPQGEVLCSGQVQYAGQIVGVVVAKTAAIAKTCAGLVVVPYTNPQKVLITAEDAVNANSFHDKSTWPTLPPVGDVNKAFSQAQHVVEDTVTIGQQQHFHLESHVCVASPSEGGLSIVAASQNPVTIQETCSTFVQHSQSKITVQTKRCGGGYGGKGTNSLFGSCIASMCALKLNRPVSVFVDMQDTMKSLGCREDYFVQYKVGFNNDGTIVGLQATVNANAGCNAGGGTGGAAGAAMVFIMSLDNCYNIPNWSWLCRICKTNIASATSTRGPGWISSIYTAERIVSRVAAELGVSVDAIRQKNFYTRGCVTPIGMPLRYWNMDTIFEQLKVSSNYAVRQEAVAAFNQNNKWVKRGIAIQPSRFAVSDHMPMSGKFGALVCVYPDGTVGVTHGGIEIGQGVNTKVAQAVAYAFGIDISNIRVYTNTTIVCPDASNLTGSSTTSELCSLAAMNACKILNERIAPFRQSAGGSWPAAVGAASQSGVELSANGWSTPLAPAADYFWDYNSYSAAVSEVELDVLTGMYEIKRTDILFDCGISMNPVIDIGQVEGGFMFGVGYFLQEKLVRDPTTGQNLTAGTWEYKPPSAYDLPETFNVTLLRDAPNPRGVLSSKACGEPPLALAASVVQALEEAVTAARTDLGVSSKRWVCPAAPLTVDALQQACGLTQTMLVL